MRGGMVMRCQQRDCENEAHMEFYWPGSREWHAICPEHWPWLKRIGEAAGLRNIPTRAPIESS